MDAPAANTGTTRAAIALLRRGRELIAPLILGVPAFFWVAVATYRASLTPLGRDQGIFQYIAWAVQQGARDYRDVRDVNGPLTHLIHRVFLLLGGADEHRFRILDLAITGATFALVGFCLPGATAVVRGARAAQAGGGPRHVTLSERLGWALAAWVVLSSQYLVYLFWDLAQRESFFDWFLLTSVAFLLLSETGRRGGQGLRRPTAALVAAGAFSVIPWFGKPTYGLFTAVELGVLVIDSESIVPRGRRILSFLIGGALGGISQLIVLAQSGDVRAYLRIAFVDVPAMYRFIWPRAASDFLSLPRFGTEMELGLLTGALILGLVFFKELPRRAIIIALLPACGAVNAVVQAKGFPYHFHPVTATVHLQWLVLCAWVSERARTIPRAQLFARIAPIAAAAVLAVRVAMDLQDSPHLHNGWVEARGATPELRETAEYFALFPEVDFFPFEMRQTAQYLQAHTKPDASVQTYGMDPYLLFLARRMSASPYIYAYDLNADAALAGGAGAVPNAAQVAVIRAMRDEHERDLLEHLRRAPPEAFVFMDKAPLMSWEDAYYDFAQHCPTSAAWLVENYEETARFGANHVWLKRDPSAPRQPSPIDTPEDL